MHHKRLKFETLESRLVLSAGPVIISEFMALNNNGLTDGDNQAEDWIEIHNRGTDPIELQDWYLTDDATDLTRWRFPEVTLGGGGSLIVFASGKYPNGPAGELHTDFKLSGGGEYLALVQPNGTSIESEFAPEFPEQYADVSYGWSSDFQQQGYFTDPSPGASNLGEPIPDPTVQVLISEIMYHPIGDNSLEEYIELYNRGFEPVDLLDWQFSSGVQYTFPDVTIGPGEYLAVAAHVATFRTKHPTVTDVVGGWEGQLSDGGEEIELVDATGQRADRVYYADQGDWGVRQRGPMDYGHQGWIWTAAHDGLGRSLELINPALSNNYGQNWAASTTSGGTPGAANSVSDDDIRPMILDVGHFPIIPHSNESVTVTARLRDELSGGISATVYYRNNASGAFLTRTMYDDGLHNDGEPGDGLFGGVLPAAPHDTVVEFYVRAEDGTGNTRTWPAAVEPTGQQLANALYQVRNDVDTDAPWNPASQPIYYMILTPAEEAELIAIGDYDYNSNAQMNGTFISVDGNGIRLRYNMGVRNRGHGSRNGPPNNYRVNFPADNPWKDVTAININCRDPHEQALGSAIHQMSGTPAPNAAPIQVRLNGDNRAQTGGGMYGSYVQVEAANADFADRHFPGDGGGNLYKVLRDIEEGDLRWEGTDVAEYSHSYFKMTNESENDYSGLIHMIDVLNNAPTATYLHDVSEVIDLEQWLRYLALDSLFNNQETGLNRGYGDDYMMYSGVEDPRFVLVPHDMDTIFGGDTNYSIFAYNGVPGLNRLLNHPDITPLYYRAFLDLIDTLFNPQVLNPLIDHVLGGYLPASVRSSMKSYVVNRTAGVLAQIPIQPQADEFSMSTDLPTASGYHHTTQSGAEVYGTAGPGTGSVLVGGVVADFSPATGTWSIQEGTSGTLVAPGSATTYHVPTAGEDSLAWTQPDFDDAAWSGTRQLVITEVGIDTPDFIEIQNLSESDLTTEGWVVAVNHGSGRNINRVQPVKWALPETIEGLETSYRSDDVPGADDYFGENIYWSSRDTGWAIIVDDAGKPVDFAIWGYTEAELAEFDVTINGGRIRAADVWQSTPVSSASAVGRSMQRVGNSDRDTASDFAFLPSLSMGIQNPLLELPFQGNPRSPGSTGFGFGPDIATLAVRTNVQQDMQGVNASFWIRIPFESPDPALFETLRLQMKYNDGFVAYLGGQEIARRNAPGSLQWNSTATASRTPQESVLSETIDVTAWLGALRPGTNLLAVHGLNDDASDENFLLLPELVGTYRSDASMGLTLDPGINRVWVETFEGAGGTGAPLQRDFIDIWSGPTIASAMISEGPISGELTPSDGPYLVTGNATVEAGTTLVIRPGTTIFFADGAGLTVNGRLVAEGTEYQSIRFTRLPGTTDNWAGIQFVDTAEDNRIAHAVIEYATTDAGMVGLENSNLLIDHATFDHAERRRIRTVNSSLIVRDSTFTDIFPGNTPPATDNGSEHVFGQGIPDGGHFILDDNVFGAVKGRNNAVEFDAVAPGAVIQIFDNTFLGSGDDALDLQGNARIEGNVFTHVHNDSYNADPGESAAISIAAAQDLFVHRNVFYDVGHAVMLKDQSLMTFINNTVADTSAAAIDFNPSPQPGSPGAGAYVDSSIFADTPAVLADILPTTELTVNRSILPAAYHSYGVDNLDQNVSLVDPAGGDFNVAGMEAVAIGAMVPAGLFLSGEPGGTLATEVTLTVSTPGEPHYPIFSHYKYRLNDGPYSDDRPIDQPIELTGLQAGQYTVRVIGKNSIGLWQDDGEATVSKTWTVDTGLWRVRINEVLANNVATLEHEGTYPDLIELINDGGVTVDLSGMSLSDTLANPTKFVFPDGTSLEPGEYLVLFADKESNAAAGHLGFALDGSGEAVYLFDTPANNHVLIDSIEFGLQAADSSIGRVGPDAHWALTQPTFGAANIARFMGDSSTLKINEWLTDGGMRFAEDFLELYNPDPAPVSLAGFYLTDDPVGQPDKDQLPPLSFIAGSGYATFAPDNTRPETADHLGFKLSAEQGLIGLYDSHLREIDKVLYYTQTTDVSQGRSPDGAIAYQFFELPTPGAANVWMPGVLDLLDGLRVTELMYHPTGSDQVEFVELLNISDVMLDLTGVRLSGAVDFTFPDLSLPPGGRVVVVQELDAFYSYYGSGINVAGQYSGSLSDGGEELVVELAAPLDMAIQRFDYDDKWHPTTDGGGFALTIVDAQGELTDWNLAASWQAGSVMGGSPGRDDAESGTAGVVISEVLSHTTLPATDAIELHNTSSAAVDVGGWFLSDSVDHRQKFRIPTDGSVATLIPPGGYLVFDETHFNPSGGLEPEQHPNDFALNGANGDDVWLTRSGTGGEAVATADYVRFGAARNGESFGRRIDDSGRLHFYPNEQTTLPGENSPPRVGPVILSELHYNPGAVAGADDLEFVELLNTSHSEWNLSAWRLRGGIDFDFSGDMTIAPRSTLLVLPFDPSDVANATRRDAFLAAYGIDASVAMVGGYGGKLDNGGETVRLQRPDTPSPSDPTYLPNLLEDEVSYDDMAPWPLEADGLGQSLQRIGEDAWGHMGASWTPAVPTPGFVDTGQAEVVGRYVFYNGSMFDGESSDADARDDAAIATDKTALLPGNTARFANYTSYDKGINGIIIDMVGLANASGLDAATDFEFKVGNSADIGGWAPAPAPLPITVRAGQGVAGSDRVTIRFADGAIRQQWLQVTVLDTADTGLSSPDVFYFGNAIGEAGDRTINTIVDATDEIVARNFQHSIFDPAEVDDRYDYNRDRLVNASDQVIARSNQTNPLSMLRLITPPAADAVADMAVDMAAAESSSKASQESIAMPRDLDWLYEYQQSIAKGRSPQKISAVDAAIDLLLADYEL